MLKSITFFLGISLLSLSLLGCSNVSSNDSSSESNISIVNDSSFDTTDKRYELYLKAQEAGYIGTYEEWLETIKGKDGSSILYGEEDPDTTTGNNGDVYINITSWDIFAKNENEWIKLGNIIGPKGDAGQKGKDGSSLLFDNKSPDNQIGNDGDSYINLETWDYYVKIDGSWLLKGNIKGNDGSAGNNGKSAYEIAIENGFQGSLEEWLLSLIGPKGEDGDNGNPGNDGKSAYELAVEAGYQGTSSEWLSSLIGEAGQNGTNGKSAYELAKDLGYQGTLEEWLLSLVGPKGENGENGSNGNTGSDGKSAYELAVENGFDGTLEEWLLSLVGPKGNDGEDGNSGTNGKSAYEIAVENGFEGSKQEWLDSLKGEQGNTGIGIRSVYINDEMHFVFVLTDGSEIDVGVIPNEPSKKYNVKFYDYNDDLLKIDEVYQGEDASAPTNPIRKGYHFTGWSELYSNVQTNLDVYAQYELERNQLCFEYVDNGDNTLTISLSVCGEVNLYGLEFNLSFNVIGGEFQEVTAIGAGGAANYVTDHIKYSFAANTGKNINVETKLLEMTFIKASENYEFTFNISNVDIFDENFVDETYTVLSNSYVK